MASNVSKMSNSARNDKKNSAADGGFTAFSPQFLNKFYKSTCHTKSDCCNSFFLPEIFVSVFKSGIFILFLKNGTSFLLPLYVIGNIIHFLGITNFDLLGNYGRIKWLRSFFIIFVVNLIFGK